MAKHRIFSLLLLFLIYQKAKLECGHGWVQGITADKCIRAFSDPQVWIEAETYCEEWGGYLASISSAFENTYIANYAKTALNTSSTYWLGGSTLDSQFDPYIYNWTWADGTNMTYNRFAPNQFCVIYDDCCLAQSSADQFWYIKPCEHDPPQLPYICELVTPPTVVPPTTTPWPGLCPTDWQYNNLTQKCYISTKIGDTLYMRTMNETREWCKDNFGADLVSIHSKEENDWITDFIRQQDIGVAWIGIYDPRVNGNWQWTDGTPFDYSSWGQNDPRPSAYCAYISSEDFVSENEYKGLWYSQDLDLLTSGICVLPAKGSPTQPTQKPTTPQWSDKCDPGWEYYDAMKKCYRNLAFDMEYDECRVGCQHVEANLATIHSAEVNELLTEFIVLSATNEVGLSAWIGLYSPGNDGKFQWLDGSPLNFTAWDAGEPKTGTYGVRLETQGRAKSRAKWASFANNYLVGCFCAKNSY